MISQLTSASLNNLQTLIHDPLGIAKKAYNLLNGKSLAETIVHVITSENHLPGRVINYGTNKTAEYVGKAYLAKYIDKKIYEQIETNFDFYLKEILVYLNDKSLANLNAKSKNLEGYLDHFLFFTQTIATAGSVLLAKTDLLNQAIKQPLLNSLKGRIQIPLNNLTTEISQKIGKIILKGITKQALLISVSSLVVSHCSMTQLLKGTDGEPYAHSVDGFLQTTTSWKAQLVYLGFSNATYGIRPLKQLMNGECLTLKELILGVITQKLQQSIKPWLQSIDNPIVQGALTSINQDAMIEGLVKHLSTILADKIILS